jgi:hypothetical protein
LPTASPHRFRRNRGTAFQDGRGRDDSPFLFARKNEVRRFRTVCFFVRRGRGDHHGRPTRCCSAKRQTSPIPRMGGEWGPPFSERVTEWREYAAHNSKYEKRDSASVANPRARPSVVAIAMTVPLCQHRQTHRYTAAPAEPSSMTSPGVPRFGH